jgi:hypothetical protein
LLLGYRYTASSKHARECGLRLLRLTRGYENLLVPAGIGIHQLGVLALVARARHLLKIGYEVADLGASMEAAIIVRALNESLLTLAWLDADPELGELVWMLDEIRSRLSHHREVAAEERKQRARARRRAEPVRALAPGETLGLFDRGGLRRFKQYEADARAQIDALPRKAQRLKKLKVKRVSEVPSFKDRAAVAGMPWAYSLAYRFDSNAAAHPSPLAVQRFLEPHGDWVRVLPSPEGAVADPYYVAARLFSALVQVAGRHVDHAAFEAEIGVVVVELDQLAP